MRRFFALLLVMGVAWLMVLAVAEMPTYGQPNPTHNAVMERYLTRGPEETGAVNVVAGILADYRAYDTLIETTVLFAAVAAALLALGEGRHRGGAT
ncbi:MAG: hypothetical protein RDU89_06515 [bacterium]|nr:hypothetical protein [bacterium]